MKHTKYKLLSILFFVFSLTACGGGDSEPNNLPDSTFEVDTTVRPSIPDRPGFTETDTRPVAALIDENGQQVEFIENELLISTEDDTALNALIERWNGEVLMRINAETTQIPEFPNLALIRVDVSDADISSLEDHIGALAPNGRGDLRFSSMAAMQLLSVSATESRNGILVGINFVAKGNVFNTQTRQSDEADITPTGYSSNAFTWDYMNANTSVGSSVQDIGVTEAWRALDAADRLVPGSVKIAVLDQGFAPDEDFHESWTAMSNVLFVDPINTPSFYDCSGGIVCRWHGTNVVGAAMGVPGNEFGSAGPAGPVAAPVLIFTDLDLTTSINAIAMARSSGARIVNMSYSVSLHFLLSWLATPFNLATAAFHEHGDMLLIAGAGNSGINVDSEACLFGACVESYFYAPCENSGVICVGGIAQDSQNRASPSNYGAEDVDLFAPYTLLVGPDPDNPGNMAQSASGTSMSSPFVAGVAALVKAADPSLSANEVEQILIDTAHTSQDDDVVRYINAAGAVRAVLGDVPPNLNITSPDNGDSRQLNQLVSFNATVFDAEEGVNCCLIFWESDTDGFLGAGNSLQYTFTSAGSRVITARTSDITGTLTQESITLNIVNSDPSVTINKPLEAEEIFRATPYVLRSSSFDANEVNTMLPCSSMVWTSTNILDAIPNGCDPTYSFITTGTRTITLTGTDSEGSIGTDTVTVNVVFPPANLPPQVEITNPTNGSQIPNVNSPMSLNATVVDDFDAVENLNYVWAITYNDSTYQIGTDKDISWVPSSTIDFSFGGAYILRLTLSVTDSAGNTGSDFVEISTTIIN